MHILDITEFAVILKQKEHPYKPLNCLMAWSIGRAAASTNETGAFMYEPMVLLVSGCRQVSLLGASSITPRTKCFINMFIIGFTPNHRNVKIWNLFRTSGGSSGMIQ